MATINHSPNNIHTIYYSIYVLNRAGTLLFQKDFVPNKTRSENEYIHLASTFHGLHAISGHGIGVFSDSDDHRLSNGITAIHTKGFKLSCFHSPTGFKVFMITNPQAVHCDEVLHEIYKIFCDYALKNPFYQIEQPIRCQLFDYHINQLITIYSTL